MNREITNVAIPKVQNVGQCAIYQIDLKNEYREWTVLKRFNAFKILEQVLAQKFQHTALVQFIPKLPRKKLNICGSYRSRVY
jgi:hypothetical protein